MSMITRAYSEHDRKAVENICRGNMYRSAISDAFFECFCLYYIEEEPQSCFIAEEGGKVTGYILCAEDFEKWEGKLLKRCKSGILAEIALSTITAMQPFSKDYPAHLHINMAKSGRHKGGGTLLLNTLKGHLIEKGVKGLLLNVASDNVSAMRFYEKNSFKYLKKSENECIMGVKL